MYFNASKRVLDVRRLLLLAMVSALACVPSLLVTTTGTARASTFLGCADGDFCIYEGTFETGGKFHYSGSDQNLSNDHFVGGSGGVVDNHGRSWVNSGFPGPYDDVLVYDALFYGAGATLCTTNRMAYELWPSWLDRISSYAWVNSC